MSKQKIKVLGGMAIIVLSLTIFYWLQSSSAIKSSPIVANNKTDLQAGEVRVSKTAKKVAGMVNQWDITLRVEGKDQFPPPPTDVVLVVDTSGSMNSNSRMDKAKKAASSFVDEILKDGYENRLALITYGDDVSEGDFKQSSNRSELHDTIKKLTANGGTYTQKALDIASKLIAKSTADRRYIVLISDGLPTYSYKPTSTYTELNNMEEAVIDGKKSYQTTDRIPKGGFTTDKVGIGKTHLFFGGANPDKSYWYYNHANSAIAQSNIIKNEKHETPEGKIEPLINELYTIGVDLDSTQTGEDIEVGNQTMKKIASSEDKCFTVNSDELKNILDGIAGEIVGALKSAEIVDPMGEGFVLDGDFSLTQGTKREDAGTIRWVMGGLIKEDLEQDPSGSIKYAEMTYRVSTTNDVLADGVIDTNGLAATNGTTTMQYIDSKNETQSIGIDVPLVKPIILTLQKKLLDMNDQEIQDKDSAFTFKVGDDDYTKNDLFTLYSGESERWVHPWKEGSEYTIEEENISADEYEVKININGETFEASTAKFKFQLINDEYEHKTIVVQNRKLPSFKTAWLNIRQSVINSHEDLVIPSKGYYKMMNEGTAQESRLVSGSTNIDSSDKVTQELFTRYQYNLNKNNLEVTIHDLVPEYYTILGHIVTSTDNNLGKIHVSTNKNDVVSTNNISLNYQTENEYWVTVFIVPSLGTKTNGTKEDSPRPYSWSYKTNEFQK